MLTDLKDSLCLKTQNIVFPYSFKRESVLTDSRDSLC